MRIHIIYIFLLLSINYVFAEDIKITTNINKNEYFIADKILVEYHIDKSDDYKIILPQLPTFLGTCELVNVKYDSLLSSLFLEVISFETGRITLPPITFVFEEKGTDRIFTRTSEPLFFQVNEIEIDTSASLKEISDEFLQETKFNLTGLIIIIFVILALVLLFLSIYKFYISYKIKE